MNGFDSAEAYRAWLLGSISPDVAIWSAALEKLHELRADAVPAEPVGVRHEQAAQLAVKPGSASRIKGIAVTENHDGQPVPQLVIDNNAD